tara:strand:+ start:3018 stop:3503 length:486 start_codon:yes stop_codon:yes gene_type:complete
MNTAINRLALELGEQLAKRRHRVTTAESCTGGGVASAITEVAGSSGWFEVGYVTYSNRHKQQVLGVAKSILAEHGAVSEAVVRAMVDGALKASGADYGIAISGIAGPTGGSADKPVGTVWFAWQGPLGSEAACRRFDGDRRSVREQAVEFSLHQLLHLVSE